MRHASSFSELSLEEIAAQANSAAEANVLKRPKVKSQKTGQIDLVGKDVTVRSVEYELDESYDRPGCYVVYGDGQCLYVGAAVKSPAFCRALAYKHHNLERLYKEREFKTIKIEVHTVDSNHGFDELCMIVGDLEEELIRMRSPKWNKTKFSSMTTVRENPQNWRD